jgi:hypothetical protein
MKVLRRRERIGALDRPGAGAGGRLLGELRGAKRAEA